MTCQVTGLYSYGHGIRIDTCIAMCMDMCTAMCIAMCICMCIDSGVFGKQGRHTFVPVGNFSAVTRLSRVHFRSDGRFAVP